MKSEPKVVVITGASAGVGRAAARLFARHGFDVALVARDADRLGAARRELQQQWGVRTIAIAADVAEQAQVDEAAERAERELGPIGVWVNNAMVTELAPLAQIAPEDFRRVTDVTYHGVVWGTMAALKHMRPRNRGTIVQVGSALAYRAIPLQSPYCGAKHAVRGFTESVRTELLHDRSRVHITLVELPGINTPQFEWCKTTLPFQPQPLGTVYEPEVAARAIVWAAGARRREVYVTPAAALAIWTDKWLPGALDRYLALTAVKGQQSNTPIPSQRPVNLWKPVAGDQAAHGRFGARARPHSLGLWLSIHRDRLLAAGLVAVACWYARRASAR